MNHVRYSTVVCAFVLSVVLLSVAYGQVSQYVIEVKVPQATERTSLSISVELTQNTQIQRVVLHYREFGATEYKELEMLLSGRTAVATLPGKAVTPPYIEYYVGMQLADNKQATFPLENPEMNPLKIQVKEVDQKDLEARFLSPEPGETLAAEDLAIAVSLMFTSDVVDRSRTRIYLDEADVTQEVLISDDVILYNPNNFDKPLNLGTHSIKIELLDTLGKLYYTKQTDFNLSTAAAIEEVKTSLQYMGNGQLEFRNEKIDVTNTTYARGDLRLNGTYKYLTFGGDIHVTNEEKSDRQPQNRFLAMFQVADYVKLQIGDAYPVFPSLLLSGKRVRGITSSITFGFFNLDVTYGKTDRAVEGTLGELISYGDSSTAAGRPKETVFERFGGQNPTTLTDTLFYRTYTSGTFARNFFAIRPSFGSGENFQFGLTYLKAKDDKSSVSYGTYPQENFAVGTDLLLAFDDQKMKWVSQAAISMVNNDISSGNWTDDEFKQFGIGKSDSAKVVDDYISIAKIGRNFITVNDQIWPINPASSSLPSLAYESELTLNYFNNYVRAMVFRRGVAYKSFGNEFIQQDIAGINISDRIRLFDNRMMASVSYETKSNNTQNEASNPTTTYNTLNTSVTVYPGVDLPSFTVGYGLNSRKNDVSATETDSVKLLGIAHENTDRIFVAANYDFRMVVRNSATASLSIATKKDQYVLQTRSGQHELICFGYIVL